MKILTGNSNPPLVKGVVRYLESHLGHEETLLVPAEVGHFGNGEVKVYLGPNETGNVRDQDVYIIQSTKAPAENILELLILIDAAARASARTITVVFPFFAYGYQDRKEKPRVPISAKLIAKMFTAAGATRFICFDLHSAQIQGFFDSPHVEHVYLRRLLVDHLSTRIAGLGNRFVLVAPDLGSSKVSRSYASRLGVPLTIIDKKHDPRTDEVKAMALVGTQVRGATACIIDDSIRSGRTVVNAAEMLLKKGAKEVWTYAVHPDFAPSVINGLAKSEAVTEIGVTNTLLIPGKYRKAFGSKLRVIRADDFIGETIRRVHVGESLSSLFNWKQTSPYSLRRLFLIKNKLSDIIRLRTTALSIINKMQKP